MSTLTTIYEVVPHASRCWRLRINGAHEIAFPNRDIARAAARVRARVFRRGGHLQMPSPVRQFAGQISRSISLLWL